MKAALTHTYTSTTQSSELTEGAGGVCAHLKPCSPSRAAVLSQLCCACTENPKNFADLCRFRTSEGSSVFLHTPQQFAGACGSWRRWPLSGGPAGPAAATALRPGLGRPVGLPSARQGGQRRTASGAPFATRRAARGLGRTRAAVARNARPWRMCARLSAAERSAHLHGAPPLGGWTQHSKPEEKSLSLLTTWDLQPVT